MFNAYETLGIKPVFDLVLPDLEKAYIRCIGQIHPDQQRHLPEEQRKKSLEEAAIVNEAYRILKDPLLRAQHLLGLHDYSLSFAISASSEILRESMTLRESLEEAETSEAIEPLLKETRQKMDVLLDELQSIFKVGDMLKSHALVARLTYLKKFVQEAQEKLWSLEDGDER